MTAPPAAAYAGTDRDGRRWQVSVREAYAELADGLRAAAPVPGDDAGRTTVDHAVGLLAGRARCRLADAHRHLLRMAGEQGRSVADVAAGVVRMLDLPDGAADLGRPLLLPPLPDRPETAAAGRVHRFEPSLVMVQRVLDVLPGAAALFTPVRDASGRLIDLACAAASPEAVTTAGRRGAQLIGARLGEDFPESVTDDRWLAYDRVLDTGIPADVGPFGYGSARYSVRAHRLGQGLLMSW